MFDSKRFGRGVVAAVAAAGFACMTACSGGGSSGNSPVPSTQFCGNDTQYALARPQGGQSISSGSSTVEIVASGNANQIARSYQNFDLLFVPSGGNGPTVPTGPLTVASDPGGYHPFPSDYYYSGLIASPGLAAGTLYDVYVNAFTTNCTPIGIGQLGTP